MSEWKEKSEMGEMSESSESSDEESRASDEESRASDEESRASEPRVSAPRQTLTYLVLSALGVLLGIGVSSLWSAVSPEEHPSISERGARSTHSSTLAPIWTCSMHPQVKTSEAGLCPLCGMELIPQQSEAPQESASLKLSPGAQALARLKTVEVQLSTLSGARPPLWGEVTVDEGARSVVSAWISGRVERLRVSSVGAEVKRGQPLAELYSPEVYSAHQSLLSGLRAPKRSRSVVNAARARLRLLGLSARQVKQMELAKSPWRRVTIYSDSAGVVTQASVQRGQYVREGQALFELADLSRVWVNLRVSERDLSTLSVGQPVQITAESRPLLALDGKVELIEPLLSRGERVTRARVEVSQRERSTAERLAPGMTVYASLLNATEPPLTLTIPSSAPLFAGSRSLVYVERASRDEGAIYEARVVRLGARVGDQYPVISGLKRGERVVSRGAFTLDSESQIRGLLSLAQLSDDSAHSAPHSPTAPPPLSREAREGLRGALDAYLNLQELLAEGDHARALREARRWRAWLKRARGGAVTRHLSHPAYREAWSRIAQLLSHDLEALLKSPNLGEARAHFQHLTSDIQLLLTRLGNVSEVTVHEAYCPMAFNNTGGRWFQRASEVDNVYYGDEMRRCGTIEAVIPPNVQRGDHQSANGGTR